MAEVAIKNDNIVPYGGFFFAMNEFRRTGLGKLAEDEPNVLEKLSFVTPDGGKEGIMLAYQPTHGKKACPNKRNRILGGLGINALRPLVGLRI